MPPKQKTDQQRQDLRDRILDAARELFVARGVEAVTMREVAAGVGLSATALYLYFQDKDALIRELVATDFLALARGLAALEAIPDPLHRLRALGEGYARFALAHPNHYRLMFMTRLPSVDKHETGIEAGNPEQDAYAGLQQMVLAAWQAGAFRADLADPELIAQTLWAGMHGVCSLQITLSDDCWVDWRPFEARLGMMLDALMGSLARDGRGG